MKTKRIKKTLNIKQMRKNNITIDGLKPPVNDINETEEFYQTKG